MGVIKKFSGREDWIADWVETPCLVRNIRFGACWPAHCHPTVCLSMKLQPVHDAICLISGP